MVSSPRGIPYTFSPTIGTPPDAHRECELAELDRQIQDPECFRGIDYHLAEACLEAAILARALERPRQEVEQRFDRASRIADKIGESQQRLRVAYKRAWTVFWWYDDWRELHRLYDEVEALACGGDLASDLESLFNLWQLLNASVMQGWLSSSDARLDVRTNTLRTELTRLSSDPVRLNNAVQAHFNLTLMRIPESRGNAEVIDSVLMDLRGLLPSCEGLLDLPLQTFADVIKELGSIAADSPLYDELFEQAVEIMAKRSSEGTTGRTLLQRGYQLLQQHKHVSAIRMLGRAQQFLAKQETCDEFIQSMIACSLAYESAGLLWAARANVLLAANQAMTQAGEEGRIPTVALSCLTRLAWIELQLGRVANVLAWVEVSDAVATISNLDEEATTAYEDERRSLDQVLGILLLRTDLSDASSLGFFPGVLEKAGLLNSWMTLLYALGHVDYLRKQGAVPPEETEESVRELFWGLLNQPVCDDLPDCPHFAQGESVTMRTIVLGCEIVVTAPNDMSSIYLAETVLAALEAFLSTSLERVLPHCQILTVVIEVAEEEGEVPRTEYDDADVSNHIRILRSRDIPVVTSPKPSVPTWMRQLPADN